MATTEELSVFKVSKTKHFDYGFKSYCEFSYEEFSITNNYMKSYYRKNPFLEA